MDEHTLQILEFDKIRRIVQSYAPCSLGAERFDALAPSADRYAIETALRLVSEMSDAIALGRAPAFGEIRDVRPPVRRARAQATLSAEDLREVAATIMGLRGLRESLLSLVHSCPGLTTYAGRIHDASRIAHDIQARIDNRNKVMDSASRELSRLRGEIDNLDGRIRSLMQRLLRADSTKRVLSYPNYTITGSHYVLPVAKDYRHEIAGIVHRTSASGDTLFIEPAEAAEMSAELSLLRSHEQREVNRILRQLSNELGHQGGLILDSLDCAAELCCVAAKARFARAFGMTEPRFSDDGQLCLQEARHPLLEHMVRPIEPQALPIGTVVPITVHLGGRFDVLVVTGPNTGGKTVALKTVGLLAAMAQAGLHIPAADGSSLPIFDQILADIGDEQSIEQSLSTFSSHISRIAGVLGTATRDSLVLLDELGAGTDPAEGAALGRAILDRLLAVPVKAMITTHLGDLKTYALMQPRAENAAVEFDAETLRPTFRLRIGDSGQSSALIIARRLMLPAELVDRAEEYLETSRTGRSDELELLERRRSEAEAAREQAWHAEQDARRAREAYEVKLRELDRDAADAVALEEFRATLQPGDTVHVRKFRRPGIVKRVDLKRRMATVSHGSMQWELAWDELEPVAKQ